MTSIVPLMLATQEEMDKESEDRSSVSPMTARDLEWD